MHIVHLETGRHIYGGARQVLMLLEGLAAEGVHNTLICPDDSAIATAADAGHVDVVTMPMKGDLDVLFAGRLGQWLGDHKPDLIHVHSRRGADLWGGLAARPGGLRSVLTRRVDNPETPVVGRIKYGFYDRIVAISAAINAQLLADGATEQQVRIVRSAIDTAACEPTWSRAQFLEAFGCPADAVTVACVAQFIPRKGHADLLDAWESVATDFPAARLLLFGQGPEESVVREQVAAKGLDESVMFCGFREDLRNFLGCADLLVHPALREGLGICLLEAQAAEVPVVAARAGGIPEAVADDVSGILTEPGDAGALAAALQKMLGDREARERIGKAGRIYVEEHFSPASMVSGNLSIYKELINQ